MVRDAGGCFRVVSRLRKPLQGTAAIFTICTLRISSGGSGFEIQTGLSFVGSFVIPWWRVDWGELVKFLVVGRDGKGRVGRVNIRLSRAEISL